jgi:2-(1,2-epoxy-1,2-dihydrophenyl)acetyl-CoA isomerase
MTSADTRPAVQTQLDGDVWRVTIDRPETGNAIHPGLATELTAALGARPRTARTVLLLANGPRFSVGGDVQLFAAADDPGRFVGDLATEWHRVVLDVIHCPVPVVAGVQGAVAGAAVGLIGACDIVVCGRSTKIRPAYGAIGLSPDGGTTWALTRALGAPRTMDLCLTNGSLTAAEAHAAGLVARLVEDDEVHAATTALARSVAAGPVRAMVRTRSLVRHAAIRTLEQQLDEEARLIAESAADPEGREGVRAFVEKRTPDFRGAV